MPVSQLISAIARLKASKANRSNVRLILEHDKKLSNERISEERRKKFIDRLRWWAEELGVDFKDAKKEDLERAYNNLKSNRKLKPGTINIYLTMLKQFYKHIEGDDDAFPDKVRKLKPLPYQPELISEDGETSIRIYSPKELETMIKLARSSREKCLIALSYDSGGRLGELCGLEMSHIKNEQPFYKVYLHGDKTWKRARVGKRWASVYFAVPYINEYMKSHPFRLGEANKPFWVNSGKYGGKKNAAISMRNFRALFERIKDKAGIEGKRFHDLRHTKCTHLLRMGMPETKVKRFMGWSTNSKQLGRYAHLVQEDIDEELSRMYGLEFKRKKHDDLPIPIKCPICGEPNALNSEVCSKCFNPLTAKAITNASSRERYWKQKYESKEKERDSQMAELMRRLDALEKQKEDRFRARLKSLKP